MRIDPASPPRKKVRRPMADGPLEAINELEEFTHLYFEGYPAVQMAAMKHLALLRRHLEPQPIESAPRDGSDVLAFCPIAGAWVIVVFCDGAWVSDTAEHKPTRWLPSPPPPPAGEGV